MNNVKEYAYNRLMNIDKRFIKNATYKVNNPYTSKEERERLLDLIGETEAEIAEKEGYNDLDEMGIEY